MGLGELVAPGTLVLTDQPAEDLTALDPAHRQRDHVGIIISGSSKPERAMRPVLIVMVGVFVEHGTKVPLAEDQQPIGALRARRPYPSLGERVREMRGHGRWRGWEARWAGTVPHRLWMRSQSPCRGHGAAGIRLVGEVREAVRGHLPLSVWLAASRHRIGPDPSGGLLPSGQRPVGPSPRRRVHPARQPWPRRLIDVAGRQRVADLHRSGSPRTVRPALVIRPAVSGREASWRVCWMKTTCGAAEDDRGCGLLRL